jgi:hypothetical protein
MATYLLFNGQQRGPFNPTDGYFTILEALQVEPDLVISGDVLVVSTDGGAAGYHVEQTDFSLANDGSTTISRELTYTVTALDED